MKKIAFIVQVVTLITALPLLTVLELNHGIKKPVPKNAGDYVSAQPAKKYISLFPTPVNGMVRNVLTVKL